jgi:predicted dehydrogenase
MHVLIQRRFTDGFLDYHRGPGDYLVESVVWKNLERLQGLYYERPKSLWMIWNYLWDIGPRQTIRKVLSRNQERYRNEKYVACGVGYVRERPDGSLLRDGALVVFLAPCHPLAAERIVLPLELLKTANPDDLSFVPTQALLCQTEPEDSTDASRWWQSVRGWNPHSGIGLSQPACDRLLDQALDSLKGADWAKAVKLPSNRGRSMVQSRVGVARPANLQRKSTVLFGYGNYAKNIILPNVRKYLDVRCIHEIDPLQIPLNRTVQYGWDTAAKPSPDEKYEVFLIAGYHHTHAPLAIQGLQQNACVVVEKPIATSEGQLVGLLNAMRRYQGKVFCCFHKRYSAFNALARKDLQVQLGEPISYHCIVYEVPLPPMHWYRWPSSRSRLITNGCHWIDHFLFLNNYSEATACHLHHASDRSSITCSITLANGAFFTMVMTYRGSERIGPQDYVELRGNGRTVRIVNEAEYWAEAKHRILRKKKVNKMRSYEQMYREVSRQIVLNGAGDTAASVKGAVEVGLWLEDRDERSRLENSGCASL